MSQKRSSPPKRPWKTAAENVKQQERGGGGQQNEIYGGGKRVKEKKERKSSRSDKRGPKQIIASNDKGERDASSGTIWVKHNLGNKKKRNRSPSGKKMEGVGAVSSFPEGNIGVSVIPCRKKE